MSGERVVWTSFEGPLGPLTVVAGPQGIRNIHFAAEAPRLAAAARSPLTVAVEQLGAYFAGERRAFELALDLRGTALEKLVWEQLLEIPYGSTASYGEIAERVDDSAYPQGLEPYKRARLVGAAIGRNPVPVVVACHRVIGADGSLTGFRGGLELKRALLKLEGVGVPERASGSSRVSSQLAML
jgi:methylated-DNA-[protein]-cysteine S-methyltransferase